MSEAAATDTGATGTESQTETGSQAQSQTQGQAGTGAQAAAPTGKAAQTARQEIINELGEKDMDKLVTLKVNGKEEKIPLKEALKISRMEKASQAKMQEAAQIAKQAQDLINFAKQNPKAFFQKTGVDPYQFAEATLAEKYEMMQLTPEQKKLMEYEQRVKEFEEKEKNEKLTAQQRQHQEQMTKMQGELEKEIVEAWKDSGLPRHKYFGARISAEMLASHAQKKAGLRDEALSANEAAAIVKDKVVSEMRDILLSVAKSDAGAAQKLLGDELMKLLRDYDVQRVTGKPASSQSGQNRPANQAASVKANKSKSLSEKDWDSYWKSL